MSRGVMLFGAPMVRAIRAGNKTQTRRMMKFQLSDIATPEMHDGKLLWRYPDGSLLKVPYCSGTCPYGQPGELIAVRETFYAFGRWETRYSEKKGRDEWHFVDMTLECGKQYAYAADGNSPVPMAGKRNGGMTPAWWKRPAIHMPLIASRIMLEITAVRVERLLDISADDALAEGITEEHVIVDTHCGGGFHQEEWDFRYFYEDCADEGFDHAEDAYFALWESLNGDGSVDANHWVWVVEFRVLKGGAA